MIDLDDHLIVRDGVRCAGVHIIYEIYDADPERLKSKEQLGRAFLLCVATAGATLLHTHLHTFEPNGGISGVAVLAESHISVHTWPEHRYAAFDVFMCGNTKPELCGPILQRACRGSIVEQKFLRGRYLSPS